MSMRIRLDFAPPSSKRDPSADVVVCYVRVNIFADADQARADFGYLSKQWEGFESDSFAHAWCDLSVQRYNLLDGTIDWELVNSSARVVSLNFVAMMKSLGYDVEVVSWP